ncbi:site-specific integrase [Saccharospirillum alexandrii]|uniref:site-specific integrase n=1 Tax=Saccharospirillum alexandrii TaxID=2448477 RepID=UPI000FD7CE72|nr:site-specific integrase [Saccharospirillum alexandrii]
MSNPALKPDSFHGDELRTHNRTQIAQRERQRIDELLSTDFHEFSTGSIVPRVDTEFINTMFGNIVGEQSTRHHTLRHNHLVKRINEISMKFNYEADNFRPIQTLGSESTLHTPKRFINMELGQEVEQLFWLDLNQKVCESNFDQFEHDTQRLIFSIVWFGGICSIQRLTSILKVIPLGAYQYNDLVWLETNGSNGLWRYLPDPVTLKLLERWYKDHGKRSISMCESPSLTTYLRNIEFPHRMTIRQIMEAAETRLSTDVEGLIPYLLRQVDSTTSLSQESWLRLLTKKQPKVNSDLQLLAPEVPAVTSIRPSQNGSISVALTASKRLREIVQDSYQSSGYQRTLRMISAIQSLSGKESLPTIMIALCCWTEKLLKYGGNRKDKLQPSSILRYLNTISTPLIEQLWDIENLLDLDPEEWESCYSNIIGNAISGNQSSDRSDRLQEFHDFLVGAIGAPRIQLASNGTARAVDADIITPAEFRRTLNLIQHQLTDERLVKTRQLVLILGYRCGLRRTEIAKLQVRDIQGLVRPKLSKPMLLIRPNSMGNPTSSNLKSHRARRQLPLHTLLTSDELDQLSSWVIQRQHEACADDVNLRIPLFSRNRFTDELITDYQVFSPITKAIQSVSNCNDLRFHHLRHSCISILGLRFLDSESSPTIPEEWACDDDGKIALPHWGRDLYAVCEGVPDGHLTRQRIRLLSLIAGHASPGQTIFSYSHLLDYASYCRIKSTHTKPLSSDNQAALLGVTPESLRVRRSRNKLSGPTTSAKLSAKFPPRWPPGIRRKLIGLKIAPLIKNNPVSAGPAVNEQHLSALAIYHILYRIVRLQHQGIETGIAIDQSAEHYELSPELVEGLYTESLILMQSPKHRGRSTGYSEDGRRSVDTVRFKKTKGGQKRPELPCCPAPPTKQSALPLIEYWYEKLVNWYGSQPDLAYRALFAFDKSAQRSHTQIRFRTLRKTKRYRVLIDILDLSSQVTVKVKPSSEPHSEASLIRYWSQQLSVNLDQVIILKGREPAGNRNPMGVAHIVVNPVEEFGKAALQTTLSGIRFAVFMALVTIKQKRK